MEPLAKLLVSFLDLAEVELKTLKRGLIRLGLSLVMLIGAGIFGVIGLCWLFEAAYVQLVILTNRQTALAIGGVLFLAAAGILAVFAFGQKKSPQTPVIADPSAGPQGTDNDPAKVSMRIAS